MLKPFTGDLDELVKRRVIRMGVTFNRTFYFVDKGVSESLARAFRASSKYTWEIDTAAGDPIYSSGLR